MDNIAALDVIFDFLPSHLLNKLKKEGLYSPILSKKISDGAALYDYLIEKHAALQDADYSWLASGLEPYMNDGSILQIGCGRGDLLSRLADKEFSPIYGIDRSEVMLKTAKNRVEGRKDVYLFQEKVENFNFSKLSNINNVIINNFWGMIPVDKSIKLLNELKKCITKKSLIFIGDYSEKSKSEERLLAEKTLKENLGFIFSYPFFKNFAKCNYNFKIIDLNGLKYFALKLK